jgi:hypothetical protein
MAVVRVEVGDLTRRPRRRDERERPPKTTSGGTRSPYAFGITSADGAHPARPTLVEFSEPPHTPIHTPKGPDEARTRRTSAGPSGPPPMVAPVARGTKCQRGAGCRRAARRGQRDFDVRG